MCTLEGKQLLGTNYRDQYARSKIRCLQVLFFRDQLSRMKVKLLVGKLCTQAWLAHTLEVGLLVRTQ